MRESVGRLNITMHEHVCTARVYVWQRGRGRRGASPAGSATSASSLLRQTLSDPDLRDPASNDEFEDQQEHADYTRRPDPDYARRPDADYVKRSDSSYGGRADDYAKRVDDFPKRLDEFVKRADDYTNRTNDNVNRAEDYVQPLEDYDYEDNPNEAPSDLDYKRKEGFKVNPAKDYAEAEPEFETLHVDKAAAPRNAGGYWVRTNFSILFVC